MSRINIIIIGAIGSIFLIFSCISSNIENYYAKLHPSKPKVLSKRLNPKPKTPLKDRVRRVVKVDFASPLCESVTLKDEKSILFGKERTLFVTDVNGTFSKIGSGALAPPLCEVKNKFCTVSYKERENLLENSSSLGNISLFNGIQKKILMLLKDNPITFKRSSGTVTPNGKRVLDKIVKLLSLEKHNYMLEIQGHTDAGGKRKVNLWISQKRAKGVKRYLIKRGIPSKNIRTEGFGERRLLLPNQPYSRKNRRVEIYIKGDRDDRLND